MLAIVSYSRENNDYHIRIYDDQKRILYCDFVYHFKDGLIKSFCAFNYCFTWTTFSFIVSSFSKYSPIWLKKHIGFSWFFDNDFEFA